jgi:Tol biopolymer transport system component
MLIIISKSLAGQQTRDLQIDYFGQTPPADSAIIFAPGLISVPGVLCIAFSPAGDEVCISVFDAHQKSWLFYSKFNGSAWSKIDTAYFAKDGGGGPVCFSPDGKYLTFMKSNPLPDWPYNTDIYFCTRTEKGWSQSQPFSKVINSEFREAGHSLTLDRTLYFSTGRPQDKGCDVYRARCINGTYTMAEYVPNLSTAADEDGVWVSPDENYAIVESRQDIHLKDLYISFHKEDGSWTKLKNMGPKVNFLSFQVRGRVSPDGKYLFFTGYNGSDMDIYWIRVDNIIIDLKKEVFTSN